MSSGSKRNMSRREMISGTAVVAGVALSGPLSSVAAAADSDAPTKAVKTYTNADFYNAAGEFQAEKAKEAYFDMFQRFGYTVTDVLRKGMWAIDFHLGDFAHVGMAGIFWVNRQEFGYFGHEIFLLPGQMIPEHQHLATAKGPAKMESWQPRHGMVYTFGEGEATPDLFTKIPVSQRDVVKSQHGKPLLGDEVRDLNRLKAWHFMVAGPEGALVTEYGTFHDMDGLRLSNPKAKL